MIVFSFRNYCGFRGFFGVFLGVLKRVFFVGFFFLCVCVFYSITF